MITTVVSSFIAFVSTNVDDIFILMALFSQVRTGVSGESAALAESGMLKRHIVMGQYLGFAALVAFSIIGALSSFFIPVPWIGLLGLVPIYMGIRGIVDLKKSDDEDDEERSFSGGERHSRLLRLRLQTAAITLPFIFRYSQAKRLAVT